MASSAKVAVLVVGSGGREHSLVWRLSQSDVCKHVYVAPGNPGTAAEKNVTNVKINVDKNSEVGVHGSVPLRASAMTCMPCFACLSPFSLHHRSMQLLMRSAGRCLLP